MQEIKNNNIKVQKYLHFFSLHEHEVDLTLEVIACTNLGGQPSPVPGPSPCSLAFYSSDHLWIIGFCNANMSKNEEFVWEFLFWYTLVMWSCLVPETCNYMTISTKKKVFRFKHQSPHMPALFQVYPSPESRYYEDIIVGH